MKRTSIIGLQWGDEGKGKICDAIASEYDVVVRYQGGANAGHTVKVGEDVFKLHLIPSGAVQNKLCLIGSGVAVNVEQLNKEIDTLTEKGLNVNLLVSPLAPVVTPLHILMDQAVEKIRNEEIGTTHRGIGPCYADRALRLGIRAGDFVDTKSVFNRLALSRQQKLAFLESIGFEVPSTEALLESLMTYYNRISSVITTADQFTQELQKDRGYLFEGAQGTLLDIDFGTYPFVTSSHTIAGAVTTGLGLPMCDINILGVVKAYSSRVGAGPFPTEDTGAYGDYLVEKGMEFGTTTGRRRRCGWIDIPALKHAVEINGVNEIALTKIDVLSGLESIPVCVGYNTPFSKLDRFPQTAEAAYCCKPIYEYWPGWQEDLSDVRQMSDLPQNAQSYIRNLEEMIGAPITSISVGPGREQILNI